MKTRQFQKSSYTSQDAKPKSDHLYSVPSPKYHENPFTAF